MILIPIAIFFLILAVMQVFKRNWKIAGLHACGAAISALLYISWAQSNMIRAQNQMLVERESELIEAYKELGEARNRTTDSTLSTEGAPSVEK